MGECDTDHFCVYDIMVVKCICLIVCVIACVSAYV